MSDENFSVPEILNKLEVFTDDALFVNNEDSADGVYAYTVSCGVLTLFHKETNTAGIIHISEGGKATEVLDEASRLSELKGVPLKKFTLRRFKGSETIWEDVGQPLKRFGVVLPEWETTIEPGVVINKKDGSVTFYT